MTVEYDFSDFTRLAASIGDAGRAAPKFFHQALEVTAVDVKKDWNSNLYSSGHPKHTRGEISYDIEGDAEGLSAEVGPRQGLPQAGIIKLLENGSINNPAHGYGAGALLKNRENLERGIDRAIDDALKQAGL